MAFISEEDRERAIAMMMQRQGLSKIFGRPATPIQATPSTPLPGTPLQSPVIAPQSERAVAPQQYDEMSAVRQALAQPRPVATTGNAKIDQVLAATQAAQQGGSQNFMNIMAGAQMNPEERAILQERRERNERERSELDKDKKGAAWRALAKAGFAMAQSNSPYFMQALATGMQAGVTGLDSEKAAAAEKRSRLQASDEDLRLSEIRGQQAAQERAMSIYNAALNAGKSEAEAQRLARKDAEEQVALPQRLEMNDLEVESKRTGLAKDRLELSRLRQTPIGGFGRSGRGSGGSDGEGGGPAPVKMTATANEGLRTLEKSENEALAAHTAARLAWAKAGKPKGGREADAFSSTLADLQAAKGQRRDYLARMRLPYSETSAYATQRGRVGLKGSGAAPAARPAARPAAASKSTMPKGFQGTQAVWDAMLPSEKKLFQ